MTGVMETFVENEYFVIKKKYQRRFLKIMLTTTEDTLYIPKEIIYKTLAEGRQEWVIESKKTQHLVPLLKGVLAKIVGLS